MRRAWGILVLWALALIFAVTSGRDLAFNLFYFITGVIVLAFFWAWANRRGLELSRSARSYRSQVGRYFEETLELANRSIWPKLWVEIQDDSDLPGHAVSRVVSALGRNATARWQARTFNQRRGRFLLGPVTLISGDPLGIFQFARVVPIQESVVVTPFTVELPEFSPPSGYLPGGETIHRRTPYVTASVSGVREYVPGDSFNRIHWASTARTGRLMSKEFELDPLADVWIFLDMYADAHTERPIADAESAAPLPWLARRNERLVLPSSTVEYGVTTAASIANHFLKADREVGFLSYGREREMVQPDRGERQLGRLLEILAVIQPAGRLPIAQALATDGALLARHTTLVVITASADERWVTALRGLRARGVHGVAVFLAASTFGPAPDWMPIVAAMQASGVQGYLVKYGDELPAALSQLVSGIGRGGVGFRG